METKSSKKITEKKLDEMITKFYQNLGFSDKQELRRSHMIASSEFKNKKSQNENDAK